MNCWVKTYMYIPKPDSDNQWQCPQKDLAPASLYCSVKTAFFWRMVHQQNFLLILSNRKTLQKVKALDYKIESQHTFLEGGPVLQLVIVAAWSLKDDCCLLLREKNHFLTQLAALDWLVTAVVSSLFSTRSSNLIGITPNKAFTVANWTEMLNLPEALNENEDSQLLNFSTPVSSYPRVLTPSLHGSNQVNKYFNKMHNMKW